MHASRPLAVADRLTGDATVAAQRIVPLHPLAGPSREELLLRPAGSSTTEEVVERLERHRRVHHADEHVLGVALDLIAESPARRLHVNISTRTLEDACAARSYLGMVARRRPPPGSLTVEVTETALPRQARAVVASLGALRRLGCSIALDDVVPGQWPAPLLDTAEIDVVKLDGRLLVGSSTVPAALRAVAEVVRLAKRAGALTVAEWIEDDAQLALVRALGYDLGQGYLLHRPGPLAPAGIPGVSRESRCVGERRRRATTARRRRAGVVPGTRTRTA